MPISVVVGGQFGSEGKGKVAHFLAKERRADIAVRVGGPNSGHTVIDPNGEAVIFRHLPTACLLPDVTSVIPAGSYLSASILLNEIRHVAVKPGRLVIDPDAWLVTDEDVKHEATGTLIDAIGSTGSGTGAAVARRIERRCVGSFAKDVSELKPYLACTAEFMAEALNKNRRVVIEGTQGFGLSLLHSRMYPHCTSRDTTAAAFVAESGLSPIDVDEIVLVLRAFPIRVAGNSGPLPSETTWHSITEQAGYAEPRVEYTSVTKKVRRVAHFDDEIVKRAIAHNRPTSIAMNHLDYIDAECGRSGRMTQRVAMFLAGAESRIGVQIQLLGFGPHSLVLRERKRQTAVVA